MSKYIPAVPLELDSIPREVATEMLCNPRAKLTARMRKNCFAARQTVFAPGVPVRRLPVAQPIPISCAGVSKRASRTANRVYEIRRHVTMGIFINEEHPIITTEEHLTKKFKQLPLAKLGDIARRARSGRRSVQQAFEKLIHDDSKQAIKLRRLLDFAAARHELALDCATAEIKSRRKKS
jgi:hypothetical protein